MDSLKIRTLRHELAELRTDYEELNEKMTQMTYSMFEAMKNQVPEECTTASEIVIEEKPVTPDSKNPTEQKEDDPIMNVVLRMEREEASVREWKDPEDYIGSIRTVQPNSIAERAGLLDCDRIIEFGSIDKNSFSGLKQFAEYFERSRGTVLKVVVGRNHGDRYETRTIEMDIPVDPLERLGWGCLWELTFRIHFIPK